MALFSLTNCPRAAARAAYVFREKTQARSTVVTWGDTWRLIVCISPHSQPPAVQPVAGGALVRFAPVPRCFPAHDLAWWRWQGDAKVTITGLVGHSVAVYLPPTGSPLVLTDPNGCFQVFWAKGEDGQICIGNSLLAVVVATSRTDLDALGVWQFVRWERTFASRTPFLGVWRAVPRTVYDIAAGMVPRARVAFESAPVRNEAALADWLRSTAEGLAEERSIVLQLSGGRDSRLVGAALAAARIRFAAQCNRAKEDTMDYVTARRAAAALGVPVVGLWDDARPYPWNFRQALLTLELCRNLAKSRGLARYYHLLSSRRALVLTGVGAELLRDHPNWDRAGCDHAGFARFLSRVAQGPRLDETLAEVDQVWGTTASARTLRWAEWLPAWTGAALTAGNHLGRWYAPFLDPCWGLACLDLAERLNPRDSSIQRFITETLAPALRGVPYNSDYRRPRSWRPLLRVVASMPKSWKYWKDLGCKGRWFLRWMLAQPQAGVELQQQLAAIAAMLQSLPGEECELAEDLQASLGMEGAPLSWGRVVTLVQFRHLARQLCAQAESAAAIEQPAGRC
jgi:hypothetical protein